MKTLNALVTNTAKRIIAAAMALVMLPGVLSYELVYAAKSDGSTTEDVTEEQIDSAGASEDEVEGITVWKDGKMQKLEAKTGKEWTDNSVSGGDSPTADAPSVDSYTAQQVTIPVDSKEYLYSLTAATGISPGTSVEYFAVRYTVGEGENAVAQTKYIFPKVHTLSATDDYIKKQRSTVTNKVWTHTTFTGYYSPGARLNVTQRTGTYATTNDEELAQAREKFKAVLTSDGKYSGQITKEEKKYKEVTAEVSLGADGFIGQRHSYLAALNYKINENTVSKNALSSWGVDEFLFKTDEPITEVTGVEVFMSNGKWTVQGLSVSKVNKIGGYGEYGFYSGKYFLSLEKEVICQLTKKKSGTLTLSANGDTLVNIGGDDSIYFALTTPEKKVTTSSGFKDLYTFRMDFADTTDGGIESLLRNDSSVSDVAAGSILEDLAIEIEYKDINGWTRNVTMPVLLSVIGQYKQSGASVRTIGLAQRGDTLAFTACLPDFSSIISTRLYVAKAARDVIETNCGITTIDKNKLDNSLMTALDKDRISVAGMSIYEGTCRMSNTADGKLGDKTLKSYSYTYAFSSKYPSFYYTTAQANGYMVSAKTSDEFSFDKYDSSGKDPIIGAGLEGNFMVRLKTSSITGADTTGNVKAKVYYQDSNGNTKSSKEYNVKDEVQKYLGYWPTKYTSLDNFGYLYGLSLGNYVEFPVNLPDASAVTSVEVSIDDFSDEWQLESISVAILDGIGKRRAYAQDLTAGTSQSPYRLTRPVVMTTVPPFPIDVNLLFGSGDKYAVNTGSGTIVTADDVDYNAIRYSMTYEQTQWNLGYVKARKKYDIDVKVADDPDANNANGDSGSTNQFYFQLMFKSGRSGFVLANQQLSSDGFRAGQHETFRISVNRDYGELQSVRIIPEDTSEDSQIFDKLNIEEITVTEQTGGGVGMEYVIDNVGWIDIDYHDKSEEKSILGRAGRSIGSIAQKYRVTKKRSVIYLLCEITADPWQVNHYDFQAGISCTIDYIDTNNQPQSKSFDVAKSMYDYMNRTPKVYSADYSGDNAALYTSMGTVTDASCMLKPCTTDRFILPPLANVKTLSSMTFYVNNRTKGTAYWVISGVSISKIISDTGVVSLTKDGQYYRNMDVEPHCEMVSSVPITMTLPTGAMQKQKIKLTQKDITWNEDKTWVSAVERTPESDNSTMNIYVYPTESSRNISDYPLGIIAYYNMPGARLMKKTQNAMKVYGSGTEDAMYYYTGLDAENMLSLSSLWLNCRGQKIMFDYAIVEQVKDDIVVSRYVINYDGAVAVYGLKASPSQSTEMFNKNKQTLSLSFGSLTNEANIIPPNDENSNVNDIAVAIKYRSTLDHGENEYTSPYVYLGDVGIKKLSPGMTVDVPFNIPFVKEITGYKIGMFGNIKAEVRAALAHNYSFTDGETDEETGEFVTTGDKLLETYSFDKRFEEISNGISTVNVTKVGMTGKGAVAPLELNIKTADAEDETETGNNSTIAATIYYLNHNKAEVAYEIDDLKTYIQADNEHKLFSTGKTATIKLLLPDCQEITAIEIKPSKGSWKIERIDGWLFLDKEINRVINATFDSDSERFSLKTVKLVTYIYFGDKYKGIVTKHEMTGVVEGETQIKGQVSVDGGYDLKFQMAAEDGKYSDMPDDSFRINDNKFIVDLPKNNGTVPLTFRISVSAKENPNTIDVITVTVPVPEKQETAPSGDTANTQTNTNTDTDADTDTQTDTSSADEDTPEQSDESSGENAASQDSQTADESSEENSKAEETKTDDSSTGSEEESGAADDSSKEENDQTNEESSQDSSSQT